MIASDFSYAKRGLLIRLAYLLFSILYAAFIGFGRFYRGRVVVLCYHAVTKEQLSRFKKQMKFVVGRAVKLTDVRDKTGNENKVCVTFDDAFECLMDTAVPVTRDLNIPIAIFAVTDNMGEFPKWKMEINRPDNKYQVMTKKQLIMVDKEKHCLIGSHTVNHQPLGIIRNDLVYKELIDSKDELEKLLKHKITSLALPHGSYTDQVITTATNAGYQYILTLDEISKPSKWPSGTVGRFIVSPDMWLIEFYLTVIGAYTWLYPWRRILRRVRSIL